MRPVAVAFVFAVLHVVRCQISPFTPNGAHREQGRRLGGKNNEAARVSSDADGLLHGAEAKIRNALDGQQCVNWLAP